VGMRGKGLGKDIAETIGLASIVWGHLVHNLGHAPSCCFYHTPAARPRAHDRWVKGAVGAAGFRTDTKLWHRLPLAANHPAGSYARPCRPAFLAGSSACLSARLHNIPGGTNTRTP